MPIIPILSILKGWSVVRIEVLLLPVASLVRLPDPTPSLQPHYELSSLLRVGPPQCSASVRWPRGFRRLGFSLGIRATGSCSSAPQPASASRPSTPVAVRSVIRHPADLSQGYHTLLVSTTLEFLTTRFRGFTFVRLSDAHLHEFVLALLLQRSPPRPFTAAAWSGLRSVPENRSRGAFPHLSRSFIHTVD